MEGSVQRLLDLIPYDNFFMEVFERHCVQKQPHTADEFEEEIASAVVRITADKQSRLGLRCQFSLSATTDI
jgi:hypothetical protein